MSAANTFLSTLTSTQRSAAVFARHDVAQKQRWSNLPEGLYSRQGLKTADMTQTQIDSLLDLLKTTLSSEGDNRVVGQWRADELTGNEALTVNPMPDATNSARPGSTSAAAGSTQGSPIYGQRYYDVAIIGEPSLTEDWQLQFGGHHVTVNATVKGDDVVFTPSFIVPSPPSTTSAAARSSARSATSRTRASHSSTAST